MKLYSRAQTIGLIFITALFVGAAGFFIGKNYSPQTKEISTNKKAEIQLENETSTGEVNKAQTAEGVPDTDTAEPNSELVKTAGDYSYSQVEAQNIFVYERVNEAVVNITTQTMGVNFFLEPVPMEGGSGSGSIIDDSGLVLTNTHVINDASKIFVSLYDGSQYEAKIIGIDKENDLAVLKFKPPKNMNLTTIKFGNSSHLKVGQRVLAIGNPFGLERTLTDGIVSALGRPIQNGKNNIIKGMIQTDTAINPGNSGGPLLDTKGRMIGINTMIYSTSGSSAGVGFAVPVNTAKRVVADILKYGKVRRGSIDAELVQVSPRLAEYAKLPVAYGLLVSEVRKGSNAAKTGLKGGTEKIRSGYGLYSTIFYIGGDIITHIDGKKIRRLSDYYSVLEDKKPEDTVELTIVRQRKELKLKIVLSERE